MGFTSPRPWCQWAASMQELQFLRYPQNSRFVGCGVSRERKREEREKMRSCCCWIS
uniref:Uncharacterized protein n=1 Tax=Arundo donax TaxID=35708 RepID=A0A0A9GZK0_ARUDO